MQSIGPVGILLIVVVALILFGPKRLPELGRAFGRTLRAFREGTRESFDASSEEPTRVDAPNDKRLPD
ncbi:MAG: twin-arginine translocase TatA/TatE family subunit [Paenibacillaceae bacterium]|nr:twin-arginine translocase TatA/TatE family subunit [Paenibacillaceae bacterium]